MTPRPTRERIEEIWKWAEEDCGSGHPVYELLLEIDALNVEVKTASEMCLNANDYAIRLLKERDALKAENEKLRKFMVEVTYDSGVIRVNGKPVADHSDILRTIVERYPLMTLVPTDKLHEMKEENEKLKGALSEKLHEDRDYCQEFTAVRILQEENQKLKEIINHNLTEQLYCERAQGSENQQLRERVGKLEYGLNWLRGYLGMPKSHWSFLSDASIVAKIDEALAQDAEVSQKQNASEYKSSNPPDETI